jgi:hypothetical protein
LVKGAVLEGTVVVAVGGNVEVRTMVEVEVAVVVGVVVMLNVTVGVTVSVACGPTDSDISLSHANGFPSPLLPKIKIMCSPETIWFFKMGQVESSAGPFSVGI